MRRSLFFGFLLFCTFTCLVGCEGKRSREIKAAYTQWQGDIAQGKFEQAYLLMTPDYRAKTSLEQFRERYSRLPPPMLTSHAVVRGDSIVPAPRPDIGTVNGDLYGVMRVSNEWRFTGVDGGYVHIVGDK